MKKYTLISAKDARALAMKPLKEKHLKILERCNDQIIVAAELSVCSTSVDAEGTYYPQVVEELEQAGYTVASSYEDNSDVVYYVISW
jgi:tetrahydromethanopterin S-methyltransferase subunit C